MDWYGIESYLEGGISTTLSGTVNPGPVTGDINKPVASHITGDKNKPVGSHITGDTGKPIGSNLTGDVNKPIGSHLTGDVNKPIATQITGDPAKPVASTVDLLNIPHLTLNDIKDIVTPKFRMHIPNYQQMSFKLLGVELFTWCMSGESQIISQPFAPNRFEECKIECPDEDLRPFPKGTPVHNEKDKG
jgi:hypothetical protein